MEIKEWLDRNDISYDFIEENIFSVENVGSFLVVREKDLVIDQSMFLVLDDDELGPKVDYYCFKFGSKYYYSKGEEIDDLKLLKYVGLAKSSSDMFLSNLGVHGGFELLNGSRSYSDWCKKAKFLGITSLGLAERNTLAGVIKFQQKCSEAKIKPIIGEQVVVKDGDKFFNIKLYVKYEKGWGNLLQVNKQINVDNNGFIQRNSLLKLTDGLIVVIDPKSIPYEEILPFKLNVIEGDLFWQLDSVEFENDSKDKEYLLNLQKFINDNQYYIPPILICDSYYLDEADSESKIALNDIADKRDFRSSNQFFKSIDDIFNELQPLFDNEENLFSIVEESISNLNSVSKRCEYNITMGQRLLPIYKMTQEEIEKYGDTYTMFLDLIEVGCSRKMPEGKEEEYLSRLEEEIGVIAGNGFVDYFLILWDIIRWARENDILVGIGRGSAGGCLCAYMLDITQLDPIKFELLFSRFLNEGRAKKSYPDIDTDFESKRREDVKKYMESKYGHNQVCSIGTYTNLKLKQSLKDISRLEGVDFATTNYISQILDIEEGGIFDLFKTAQEESRVKEFIHKYPQIIEKMQLILNQPKSKSIHACATLILPEEKDIFSWIPVRKEVKDGEEIIVSEWEGNELDAAGFLKEDILGITQLDKYKFILDLIRKNKGVEIDLYNIPLDNHRVYDLFSSGFNGDIFHFGSKGLTKYCKELKPENINDLVAAISLYRPGAIENNFHNEYILGKNGEKEIEYWTGTDKILNDTYAVIVYQEQVMKLCQVLGGLTLVEADDVRRAMVKKKYDELHKYKERFLKNYISEFSVTEEYAADVWDSIDKASSYLFNKCISGDEILKSIGVPFKYTIKEFWLLKNDKSYAKSRGMMSAYDKLNDKKRGYGYSWSLGDNDRLYKNKIKDIRYVGVKPIYRMRLINGATIDVTLNHKFPTNKGEKRLEDLIIGEDKIFYNIGYKQEDSVYRFTDIGVNNPNYHKSNSVENYKLNSEKGVEGFTKRENSSLNKFNNYKLFHKKDYCEICNNKNSKLEIHHIDNDHGNNEITNLQTLCISCHKKEHYKMGRNKIGMKGLYTELIGIDSISFLKNDDVFDVEMEAPNHTFVTKNNIVTSNSHAAAYAITGYIGQWLKNKYPLEYWTAAFQYDDPNPKKSKISRYISEIRKTDDSIKIKPPHINFSGETFESSAEKMELYWSLAKVRQVGEVALKSIIDERNKNGEFFSLEEFINRTEKSVINKSVITNLILAGSFDDIENIEIKSDRGKLIEKFYKTASIKKSDKTENYNSEDIFFWELKQKEVTGFGEIDYKKLIRNKTEFKPKDFIDSFDLQDECYVNKEVLISGLIVSFVERTSKKKNQYCNIELDSNNEVLNVTLWSESFERVKEEISVGKILIMNGTCRFDTFRDCNTVQSFEDSKIILL